MWGHVVILFHFLENCQTISTVATPFYIPISNEEFSFFYIVANTYLLFFLQKRTITILVGIFHCGFNLTP